MTYPIVQANDLTSMGVTITPPSYVQGVDDKNIDPVSYTHLTLPTNSLV